MALSPDYPIHLLLCTDARYAPYCGVTATSVLENSRGHHVCLHIFTDGLPSAEKRRFKKLQRTYDCDIDIITIADDALLSLPHHIERWPPSNFMRLLAADILPGHVHRLIYLDCDVVVDLPLRELWDVALDDNPCGLVADGPNDTPNFERLCSLNIKGTYFNAGMMVIDLDAVRNQCLFTRAIEALRKPYPPYACPDQDELNLILDNRYTRLSLKYNLQTSHLLRGRTPLSPEEEATVHDILHQRGNSIIHYTSEFKPWTTNINHWHPLSCVWNRYRRKSPWKASASPRLPIRTRFAIWRLAIAYRRFHTGPYASLWKRPLHQNMLYNTI